MKDAIEAVGKLVMNSGTVGGSLGGGGIAIGLYIMLQMGVVPNPATHDMDALKTSIAVLEQKVKSASREIDGVKSRITKNTESLNELQVEVAKIPPQIDHLKDRIDVMGTQVVQLKDVTQIGLNRVFDQLARTK